MIFASLLIPLDLIFNIIKGITVKNLDNEIQIFVNIGFSYIPGVTIYNNLFKIQKILPIRIGIRFLSIIPKVYKPFLFFFLDNFLN